MKIVSIVGRSVAVSVVPQIKHTGSVDFNLGYLLTWSCVITCVFFFSRYVLSRRLSTVDFSAHSLIASSRVGDSCVCVCIFFPPELCSHSAFALSFFAGSNVLFFFGAERLPMGNPILFILFSLAVKFTQDVSVAAVAIAVGGLKQSRLVWPPPIGASLIEYGQQHHLTLVDCQMLAIRKVERFLVATNTQTLLRSLLLTSGRSVWMMMMGAIRSARPSSPSTDVRENPLFLCYQEPVFNSCCSVF